MERTDSRRRKTAGVKKGDESHEETTSTQHVSRTPEERLLTTYQTSSWHFKVACYFSVSLIFVLLTGLLLSQVGDSTWVMDKDISSSKPQIQEQQHEGIAIKLHPEDHVSRPPTTLTFDWQITKGFRSPDGVRKEVYLINDQFPGETIEARSGDRIIVSVTNLLQNEGLAMHWHGLRMKNANDMDGAVGLTQSPIPKGGSFLYNFTIGDNEFGTFWYHGHEKQQRDDGLYGGFIVHRPLEQSDEKELYGYSQEILLLVGDWYHRPSTEVLNWYMNSRSFGNEPVPDSLLVNGKGSFDCAMAVPARPVECTPPKEREELPLLRLPHGQCHRLRLVNTGSLTGFTVQMDSASLSPFQVDGGNEIAVAEAQRIGIIYPGERVDAILLIGASNKQRYLKIKMDDENFKYPNPALNSYQTFPIMASPSSPSKLQFVRPELEYYNIQAALPNNSYQGAFSEDPLKFVIYTTTLKLAKHHNIPMGFINHTSWSPQQQPLISLPRSQYDQNQLSPYIPFHQSSIAEPDGSGGWVELVINNLDDGGHPFHLHGYSFYIVSVYPPLFHGRMKSLLSRQAGQPCTTTTPSTRHLQNPRQAPTT